MSAWGGPPSTGAWANQIEEEEEENGGELDPVPAPSATAFPALGGDTAFPALGDAINVRDSKKDRKNKKVKNTMSLGAFVAAGRKEPEVINLPTGPRQRAADEEDKRGGLGGGFKNYGGDRGGGFDRRDRDDEMGFGDREEEGPSRADAADDWGTKKAFVPSGPTRGGFSDRETGGGFGDKERSGGFGDKYSERRSGFGEGSLDRADTADKWGSKTFEPSLPGQRSFGERSSFGDRDGRREEDNFSKADSEDRWSRRAPVTDPLDSRSSGGSTSRPRLALQKRTLPVEQPLPPPSTSRSGSETDEKAEPLVVPRTGPRPNPFGGAKPVTVKEKVDPPPVRPEVPAEPVSEAPAEKPAAPRVRSNPFGMARPREEVLKEKTTSQSSTPPPEVGEAKEEQPVQGVNVELDTQEDSQAKIPEASNEASLATEQPEASNADHSRQESSHKEAASTADNVEAVTDSLQTKVVIDHGEKQSPKLDPKQDTLPEEKPAKHQEAVAERHPAVESNQDSASGGSWAKVAARPMEGAAKQAVET